MMSACGRTMLWDCDESGVSLANAAFDAEIAFDPIALEGEPPIGLRPVSAEARVGSVRVKLIIQRQYSVRYIGPRQEKMEAVWWCVDFNSATAFCDGSDRPVGAELVDRAVWLEFVTALHEGLRAFLLLKPEIRPRKAPHLAQLLHFTGGRIGDEWLARSFCSLGSYSCYPVTREVMKIRAERTLSRFPISTNGWGFEDGITSRMVHLATRDTITHDGCQPHRTMEEARHHFRYEGRFGSCRIPVSTKTTDRSEPMPRGWDIECGQFDMGRHGSGRSRDFPGIPASASMLKPDWLEFQRVFTDSLLRWPECKSIGRRPMWLNFNRSYHENIWGAGEVIIGLDNVVTGLGT
jgi:hypothetical protein